MQAFFVTKAESDNTPLYDEFMQPGGRPAKKPRSDLGERISQARLKVGLSQKQIAEEMGVTQQVVAAWERKTKSIRTDTLIRLAEVLKTSPDELLGIKKKVRQPSPKGRLNQVFEAASKLPRRQQQKIVELLEPFVASHSNGR